MSEPTTTITPEYGPAMQALPNERWRAFVVAAVEYPKKNGRWTHAALAAGFGNASSSRKSIGVMASRLANDERIIKALEEENRKFLRRLGPSAVHALDRLIENPEHKDHCRAIAAVIDRADPLSTSHLVKVEHEHRVTPAQIVNVQKRIRELATRAGLLTKPETIDAEFKVVGEQP